jgi:hypothetical protein
MRQVFAFGSYRLIKHFRRCRARLDRRLSIKFPLFSRQDRPSQVNVARAASREQVNLLDSMLALAGENLWLRERDYGRGRT